LTPESLPYVVCCVGVGGSLLALAGLLIEARLGQKLGHRLSGFIAALLGVVATGLWLAGTPPGVWASVAVLACVAMLAWASRARQLHRLILRLGNANLIWLMLLIAAPLGSWWLVRAVDVQSPVTLDGMPIQSDGSPGYTRKAARGMRALTDRGCEILLFEFEMRHSLEELEEGLLTSRDYAHQIIQILEPSKQANCHGWVFADGQFGVPSEQVDVILADNGYRAVDRPRENDLAVYRNIAGDILHTGVVQLVSDEGLVLVESKWGPLGVFLHPAAVQPYGANFGYYRTSRPNHRLRISNVPADEASSKPSNRAETLLGNLR
jgi:hypothetical protein